MTYDTTADRRPRVAVRSTGLASSSPEQHRQAACRRSRGRHPKSLQNIPLDFTNN